MKDLKITKGELLKNIIDLEAKISNIGVKCDRLKKEYAKIYSEFKHDDKVILELNDGPERYGIIDWVKFDTSLGFRYAIKPKGKNWSDKTNRRAYYFFNTSNPMNTYTEVKAIKKAQQ